MLLSESWRQNSLRQIIFWQPILKTATSVEVMLQWWYRGLRGSPPGENGDSSKAVDSTKTGNNCCQSKTTFLQSTFVRRWKMAATADAIRHIGDAPPGKVMHKLASHILRRCGRGALRRWHRWHRWWHRDGRPTDGAASYLLSEFNISMTTSVERAMEGGLGLAKTSQSMPLKRSSCTRHCDWWV